MNEPHPILGIGELLWDILPHGKRLGGAPANFAVMAGRLGNRAAILSRIGRDDFGRQAVERLDSMPIETSFLQVDAAHETGRVTVSFEGQEPHYTIHQPAAWDFLELSDEWIQLIERADAICFGTLAQRQCPLSSVGQACTRTIRWAGPSVQSGVGSPASATKTVTVAPTTGAPALSFTIGMILRKG